MCVCEPPPTLCSGCGRAAVMVVVSAASGLRTDACPRVLSTFWSVAPYPEPRVYLFIHECSSRGATSENPTWWPPRARETRVAEGQHCGESIAPFQQ